MQPPRRPPGRPQPQRNPGDPPFPGHPQLPQPGAAKAPGALPAAPKAADHGEHHCPGHGPNDGPGHINWYQGLLGVNNQKALSPSFVDRLLWRYKNDKDECDTKNQEPPVLGSAINFAIVLFVLFRFGKGPVLEGLSKRKKTIMADIDAATELKTAAQKRLKDYEKQLGRIESRRKELHQESQQQWEAEQKRILAEAEERGARLRRDAELRVEQELKQAESDLLREAVDSAVAAAEELLKKRIQSSDQDRLADEFATGLGASLAQSRREGRPS